MRPESRLLFLSLASVASRPAKVKRLVARICNRMIHAEQEKGRLERRSFKTRNQSLLRGTVRVAQRDFIYFTFPDLVFFFAPQTFTIRVWRRTGTRNLENAFVSFFRMSWQVESSPRERVTPKSFLSFLRGLLCITSILLRHDQDAAGTRDEKTKWNQEVPMKNLNQVVRRSE